MTAVKVRAAGRRKSELRKHLPGRFGGRAEYATQSTPTISTPGWQVVDHPGIDAVVEQKPERSPNRCDDCRGTINSVGRRQVDADLTSLQSSRRIMKLSVSGHNLVTFNWFAAIAHA
jgi:hypothetical protein